MYKQLNKAVQKYSNKKYSFITGNGTSAIYIALKSCGIEKGSKILVPNISCPDPVYSLIWAGYEPIFVDVNIEDYNVNVDSLEFELKKDKDIKAIIAIHLFGNSCDIVSISKLARKYNCFLVEDCAQSFGNEINEGKLGSFGDVSIFSFGNGKIIEVGHGGSVQTNDQTLMNKIIEEYNNLSIYNYNRIENLGKKHRILYYKIYNVGIKYPILNILNLLYIYFFRNYYLYNFDESYLAKIMSEIDNFEINKIKRIEIVDKYIVSLNKSINLPSFNNKENILTRLTVYINNAEFISKQIRDNNISSNTMYPMLVDRFKIFFLKKKFKNSYKIKGKLLNLWINKINAKSVDKTIIIIKENNE